MTRGVPSFSPPRKRVRRREIRRGGLAQTTMLLLRNGVCFTHYQQRWLKPGVGSVSISIYMFGSSPKPSSVASPANPTTNTTSYGSSPNRVSSGVSIKGEVKFASELVIDGEVEGDITSTGKLTIGSHATVVGDIQAGYVTIQGSVEGNILATERCALEAGASLNGDVESPRFAVDENASFIGGATISQKKAGRE